MGTSADSMQNAESMETKHSGFGIASFIISISVGLLLFLVLAIGGILDASTPGGMDEQSIQAVLVGLSMIALLFFAFVAAALGIVGLFQKERKKLFAILGTVFSLGTVMLAIVVIILGLLLA